MYALLFIVLLGVVFDEGLECLDDLETLGEIVGSDGLDELDKPDGLEELEEVVRPGKLVTLGELGELERPVGLERLVGLEELNAVESEANWYIS